MAASDDMKAFGASLQGVQRDADQAASSVGAFGDSARKAGGEVKKGADASKKLGDQVKGLSSQVANLNTKFLGLTSTLDTVKNLAISVFGGRALIQSVAGYGKSLFDLSRTATATGRSFGDMKRSLEDMNKSTALGRQEAVDFFQTVDSGVTGIRLLASDISALAKTFHDEFGPSLKDATNAFKDLAAIQKHDMFLFERLRKGIPTDEMSAYGAALLSTGKANREQLETLVRVNAARLVGTSTVTKEEEENRKYIQTIEELEKAFKNLVLAIGKPLANVFAEMTPHLTNLATSLTGIIEKSKGIASAIGSVAEYGLYVAAAAILGKGLGVLLGGITGLIGVIKLLFTGRIVQPVHVTNWAQISGAGAAGGAGGFMGKAGRFARLGGAGMAIGFGGSMAAGAIRGEAEYGTGRSRAAAGVSGVTGVAAGALTGAAIGSVIPILGTALGAVAGGLIGLVTNLGNFKEAIFGAEKALKQLPPEKAYKDFNDFLRQEKVLTAAAVGKGGGRFDLEAQYELVKEFYGDTGTFAEAVESAEMRAGIKGVLASMGEVRKLQEKGINVQDKALATQGLIEYRLAESFVEQEAMNKNLTGEAKTEFVESQTRAILSGQLFSVAGRQFMEATEKGEFGRAGAAGGVGLEPGLRVLGVGGRDVQAAQERIMANAAGRRVQFYDSLLRITLSLRKSLEDQVTTEQSLADWALKYEINVDKAKGHMTTMLSNLDRQLVLQRDVVKAQEELNRGNIEDLEAALKSATSATARLTIEEQMRTLIQAQAIERKKVLDLEVRIAEKAKETAMLRQRELEFMDSQVGVLDAQLSLVDSLYAGMGPRIAIQGQLMQKYKEQHDTIVAMMQAVRESDKIPQAKKLEELNKLEAKRLGYIQKQADLAKGLRDQYVDAITAFTQVEGAFGKFVISKEQGFGKALTEFGLKGGFKTGGIGAALQGPAYQFGPGGGLQMTMPGQIMRFFTQAYEAAGYLPPGTIAPFGNIFGQVPGREEAQAGMAMGRQGQQATTQLGDALSGSVFTALRVMGTAGQTSQKTAVAAYIKSLREGNKPMSEGLTKIHQTIIRILNRLGGTEGDTVTTGADTGPGANKVVARALTNAAKDQSDAAKKQKDAAERSGWAKRFTEELSDAAKKQNDAADAQKKAAEAAAEAAEDPRFKEMKENVERVIDDTRNVMNALSGTLGKDAPRPGTAAHAQVINEVAKVTQAAQEEVRGPRSMRSFRTFMGARNLITAEDKMLGIERTFMGRGGRARNLLTAEDIRKGPVRFRKEKGIYDAAGLTGGFGELQAGILTGRDVPQYATAGQLAAAVAKRGVAIGSFAGGGTKAMISGTGGVIFNINIRGDNRNEMMRDLHDKVNEGMDFLGSPTGTSAQHYPATSGPSTPQ